MLDMSSVEQEEERDPLHFTKAIARPKLKLKLSEKLIYRPPHVFKRQSLNQQCRAIVANVASYMEMEKAVQKYLVPPSRAQKRTLMATGVPRSSITRIVTESKLIQNKLQNHFKTTYVKKEKKRAPCTNPEVHNTGVWRSLIYKSMLEPKQPLSMKDLNRKLVDANLYKFSSGSLSRLLKNMGFRIKRTRSMTVKKGFGSRTLLVEEHNRQYQKFVYLRDLRKYRAEGRPIVFTAITKLARAHCKGGGSQEVGQVLKVTEEMFADLHREPRNEQWRAVLLGAGGEQGFITGGFLIWRCIKKPGTFMYDEESNYKKYVRWVRENLIPNIPEGAVVVLENEASYNKSAEPIPTQSCEKEEMKIWLTKNGIEFSPDAAKVELFELIKQNKKYHSKYEIDTILENAGHPALRIPLHFSELNPMMTMLKELKTWMKQQSPAGQPRFVDIAKLTVSKMLTTPTERWTSMVKTSQSYADEYFAYQAPLEEKIEKDIAANNGCLDSESDEEDQDDDASNQDIEESSSGDESEEDNDENGMTNPDLWVGSQSRIFMAGDSIASSSAPPPKRFGSSSEELEVKRPKSPASGASRDSAEWELEGLITIKEEPL